MNGVRDTVTVDYVSSQRRRAVAGGLVQGVRAVGSQDENEDTTAKMGTIGRLGINTAARAGAPRQVKQVTVGGRHQVRGVRRVAYRVSNAVQAVVQRAVSAVALKLGAVGGGLAVMVASIVVVVLAVLSFIPSWMTNFFIPKDPVGLIFPMGDDYPWKDQVRDGAGNPTDVYNTPNLDTNYYYGNCTDFVFWRVNRDMGGGPGHWIYNYNDLTPHGGHGKEWGKLGNLPGWQTVSRAEDAQPGDVISFQQGVFGHEHWAGHVAMVAGNGGAGVVTENYGSAQYYVEMIPLRTVNREISAGGIVIKRNPALADRLAAIIGGGTGISDAVPAQYRGVVTRAGSICPEITPALIAAQIEAESNWNPNAGSYVGAQGIAQFMPGTWASQGKDGDGDGVADVWNPIDAIWSQGHLMCVNVAGVKALLQQGLVAGAVVDLALAGYNAGMGAVQIFRGIPPYSETQNYVVKIKRLASTTYAAPAAAVGGSADGAVNYAQRLIGMPYGRGEGNGSVDCCWLVYLAYKNGRGIELPMSAPNFPPAMQKCEYAMYGLAGSYGGRQVPANPDSLKAGDLLFFQSVGVDPAYDNMTHVAISLGGDRFIDSIPAGGVGIRTLGYYASTERLVGAVRVG